MAERDEYGGAPSDYGGKAGPRDGGPNTSQREGASGKPFKSQGQFFIDNLSQQVRKAVEAGMTDGEIMQMFGGRAAEDELLARIQQARASSATFGGTGAGIPNPAGRVARLTNAARQGYAASILTAPAGIQSAPVTSKTILGGG